MKNISLICLLLATLSSSVMTQKKELVPAVILEAISEDFPEAEVTGYAAVPLTIIDDAVYVHTNADAMGEDFDTYMITMNDKNGHFEVTYDNEGHLLSSVSVL